MCTVRHHKPNCKIVQILAANKKSKKENLPSFVNIHTNQVPSI